MAEFLPYQFFKSWDLILRLKLPPSLTSSAKKVETGKYSCMCTAPIVSISPIPEAHSTAGMKHSNSSDQETPHIIPISATPKQEISTAIFKIFWKLRTTAKATCPPLNTE